MTCFYWLFCPAGTTLTEVAARNFLRFCHTVFFQGCCQHWILLKSILGWPLQRKRPRLPRAWQWMWLLQVLVRQERADTLSMSIFLLPVHQMNQKVKNAWEFRQYCVLANTYLSNGHSRVLRHLRQQIVTGGVSQYCLNENIVHSHKVSFPFPFWWPILVL